MKKVIFLMIAFQMYKIITFSFDLNSLTELNKDNDILSHSKYAITYGMEDAWMINGAEDVVTDYESGIRFIYFKNYRVFYQAFDKHDDILGTVIEKRTGTEEVSITVKIGDEWYLKSWELNKCDFFLHNTDSTVREDIRYVDGKIIPVNDFSYDEETLKNACEQMIACIHHFEETADELYQEIYQVQRTELIDKMILYSLGIFICAVLWCVSNLLRRKRKMEKK